MSRVPFLQIPKRYKEYSKSSYMIGFFICSIIIGRKGDSMKKIDDVLISLIKFLLKDKIGIRKSLLRLFSERRAVILLKFMITS